MPFTVTLANRTITSIISCVDLNDADAARRLLAEMTNELTVLLTDIEGGGPLAQAIGKTFFLEFSHGACAPDGSALTSFDLFAELIRLHGQGIVEEVKAYVRVAIALNQVPRTHVNPACSPYLYDQGQPLGAAAIYLLVMFDHRVFPLLADYWASADIDHEGIFQYFLPEFTHKYEALPEILPYLATALVRVDANAIEWLGDGLVPMLKARGFTRKAWMTAIAARAAVEKHLDMIAEAVCWWDGADGDLDMQKKEIYCLLKSLDLHDPDDRESDLEWIGETLEGHDHRSGELPTPKEAGKWLGDLCSRDYAWLNRMSPA